MQVFSKTFYYSIIPLLLTLILGFLISKRGIPVVVETNLEKIPRKVAGYEGIEDSFPESVYRELNADRHIYRHYIDSDGVRIDLYIGYYGTAKGGRTGHNPYACFPGTGWGIIKTDKTNIRYRNKKAPVNLMVAQKGNVYETVCHWYQSNKDKVLATGIQQNIQRFISRIKYNRDDGAFVRISMRSDKDNIELARKKTLQFATKIVSILPQYWPVEI
jgi:EpsI family protein